MFGNEESGNETDRMSERKKFWLVRKKSVYIVLCLILGINLPILIWLFSEMHAADKALDAFSQRLVLKDYDGAYGTTSPGFQIALTRQDFVQQQTILCTKFGPLKSVRRGNSETTLDSRGDFTTIDTTFVFENAEREVWVKLEKVNGSWRLYGYREE